MSDLAGNPEDRFSHVTAQIEGLTDPELVSNVVHSSGYGYIHVTKYQISIQLII